MLGPSFKVSPFIPSHIYNLESLKTCNRIRCRAGGYSFDLNYHGPSKLICYDPGPYHQFSAIFYHFILCSRSLVPHSFPHALLRLLPSHLRSHLIDHLTIPQSTITCHHSAVRSTLLCHHLTLSGLPAHDVLFLDRQLMMELYLELPRHDTPY